MLMSSPLVKPFTLFLTVTDKGRIVKALWKNREKRFDRMLESNPSCRQDEFTILLTKRREVIQYWIGLLWSPLYGGSNHQLCFPIRQIAPDYVNAVVRNFNDLAWPPIRPRRLNDQSTNVHCLSVH